MGAFMYVLNTLYSGDLNVLILNICYAVMDRVKFTLDQLKRMPHHKGIISAKSDCES